jgi:hypothetical protein
MARFKGWAKVTPGTMVILGVIIVGWGALSKDWSTVIVGGGWCFGWALLIFIEDWKFERNRTALSRSLPANALKKNSTRDLAHYRTEFVQFLTDNLEGAEPELRSFVNSLLDSWNSVLNSINQFSSLGLTKEEQHPRLRPETRRSKEIAEAIKSIPLVSFRKHPDVWHQWWHTYREKI